MVGVANYGGRQPDNYQNIKQFNNASPNIVLWMYKKISEIMYITPCDQTNNVYIPKDLYVYGSINTASDAILKENIEQITSCECDRILELKPKMYDLIKNDCVKNDLVKNDCVKNDCVKNDCVKEKNKKHYGFIAQEVEECFPLLVNEIDNIINEDITNVVKIKTVNYMELIPIMICKMQKMQQEIDELNNNFCNCKILS
jgi:hypothetical protein